MLTSRTRRPALSRFALLITPLMTLLMASIPARAEVLDRIVAVVNDGVVLQSDVDRETQFALMQLRAREIEAPPPDVLRSQVLEKVILTRVQTQRAQQAGIRVDDRELNEVMGNIAKQNNMTLSQFADVLRSDGGDYLAMREQIRDEVLVARLRQREVDNRVTVTDQDIELFLANQPETDDTEYRLSHILVAIPDGASPEQRTKARAKADALLEKIQKGDDFASLAVSNSDGQQALQGGDLDWRKADALPLIFLQAARRLKKGETSPVMETAGGYHIIKLADTRSQAQKKTVDETRARHILIQANTLRTEDQARLQARDIHDRLVKGEDFAKLASEFSDDPGSKGGGGEMGWQPPGVFVKEFQEQIDALQINEISAPFRTQYGWHVAQVLERRTRDITNESRRARARGAIQNRKAADEYETWLRRLRAEAYVEIRGPDGKIEKKADDEPAAEKASS
jgi:peptidyl-prolyl cis-trans isomerase SurA